MSSISREQIEDTIRTILVDELELDPSTRHADPNTTALLGSGVRLDSIDTLSLVTALEKRFDFEVDDSDLTVGLFETIRTLADYVLGKTAKRAASA